MGAILLLKYGNLRLPAGNILDLYRVRISIWLGSIRSEIFLLIKFIFFQGCPITCPFYLGSPLHVISSLFSHFCLFQNAILKFSQNLVFIGCNIFFRLALVICLSWYLYLTLSHEFLTFTSFNIWRLKCESIRFSQLELLTWHFGAKCSFQTFKRPLSDWFGPKCKCKLSS